MDESARVVADMRGKDSRTTLISRRQPKTAWSSPELIVIVRSKPAKAVLSACQKWAICGESR